MRKDLVFGMAGSGGDGIVSAGDSLLQAAAAEGYHGVMTKSFGSQIRGGESSCRVRISTTPVLNPGGNLDVAVALNWDDFLKFGAELPVSGTTVVIYEAATNIPEDQIPLVGVTPLQVIAVPIAAMAKETAGTERAKNTVVLGLIAGWFGIGAVAVMKGIRKKLAKKGEELVEANQRAFDAGRAFAMAHPLKASMNIVASETKGNVKLITDGNDMSAAAAIFAGCQFFGGYPITPSTEVMQFFTDQVWKYGGSVLQAEDEIAGIGAAVGASFAGKKAMTATSGPGLSLKSEMMGLASIAELPLVIIDVQRGGPSTGLPTKTEQSDLFAAAFSAHGDVIRPVLAPTSVADTFRIVIEAFNIAEYLSDSGDRPVRPGDRSPQGDPGSRRHQPVQDHRPPPPQRCGAPELHALQADRKPHQPHQPSRHARRHLSGLRHRALRVRGADQQRLHPPAHE